MWCRRRCIALLAALWMLAVTIANPVRRAQGELEARRRSAVDRSMIRLGRSPPELTAADVREALHRQTRRNNSFLRLGRAQPLALSTEDLISILQAYNDEEDTPFVKRVSNFVRLGRDNKFIRLGRSSDEEKPSGYEQASDLANGYPQRKNRARDHFIRLGRDSEEINEADEEEFLDEERKKRSTDSCTDCQV